MSRTLSRGISELSMGDGENQSFRSDMSRKKDITLYDKLFGVTRKQRKKEAEEAKNLLNFYDNFNKDLRKALKDLLVDDVSS